MADMQIVVACKNVEAQYVEMMVPLYSYGCEKKIKKTLSHLKGNINFRISLLLLFFFFFFPVNLNNANVKRFFKLFFFFFFTVLLISLNILHIPILNGGCTAPPSPAPLNTNFCIYT
jgi:hypothetical protein